MRPRELQQSADQLADRALLPRLAQLRDAVDDVFHRAEQLREAFCALRKTFAQRVVRGVETDRKIEHLADRAALDRVERRDRNPLDLVQDPELLQDRVLRVAGIMRIGRLMQRRLDGQRALPEGGGRPADAVIALDDADLAARLGEQRGCGKAAQARADDDGVIGVFAHCAPLRSGARQLRPLELLRSLSGVGRPSLIAVNPRRRSTDAFETDQVRKGPIKRRSSSRSSR